MNPFLLSVPASGRLIMLSQEKKRMGMVPGMMVFLMHRRNSYLY